MRYTLRLLTLDQLARAAGVVCALELMRTDPKNVDEKGRRLLGDWPIEIGLWVGSDASPNMLGGKRKLRRNDSGRARAALSQRTRQARAGAAEGLPLVRYGIHAAFLRLHAERACADQSRNPLRQHRLRFQPEPAAAHPDRRRADLSAPAGLPDRDGRQVRGLPWVGETGAFFGHVDRFQEGVGFYGAAEPGEGRPLDNGWSLDPPDLIIQDELHLIAGPLGTVAGLYEAAIDQLASRRIGEKRVRPKIVASTATVRRAADQIEALFDRGKTSIFPPPGHRSDRQLLCAHGPVVEGSGAALSRHRRARSRARSSSSCGR